MNEQTTNTKLIAHLFFRLLPLQILLALVSAVNGIVSSLFASNYVGAEAMAAIGLFSPVIRLLGTVSTVFVAGSQIACGRYMGANQVERTQSVFFTDLVITTAISLLTSAVLVLGAATDLTRIITSDDAVRAVLNRYIIGQAIGIPPLIIGQQLSAFLSLENRSRRATIASLCYIAANVVLSWLFVVVLRMDALGLALATSLGLWVFLLVQLQFYFSGKSVLKLSGGPMRVKDATEIVKRGYTGALNNGYQTLRYFIINGLILTHIGSLGMTASAAVDSVMNIFWVIPTAIMTVTRMLMSVNIGEEDRQSLVDTMRVSLYRCLPMMACVSLGLILMAVPLTRLFFRDPADPVYQMTIDAFRLFPICMPLSVILLQFSCYAQTSGNQFMIHLLSLLDGLLCMVIFTALLIPRFGMNGFYAAYTCNGIICLVAIISYAWIRHKKFPRNVEQLMVIPDDFGVGPENRIDISVRSIDDVVKVSDQVMQFCKGKGIPISRAYQAALFLEEMAVNVVEHGFKADRKSHSVDIRVVLDHDDIILRIKDDCIPFNPAELQEIHDPKDRLRGAGIRMVYKGAKDVKYQNILGLNVLTIRI